MKVFETILEDYAKQYRPEKPFNLVTAVKTLGCFIGIPIELVSASVKELPGVHGFIVIVLCGKDETCVVLDTRDSPVLICPPIIDVVGTIQAKLPEGTRLKFKSMSFSSSAVLYLVLRRFAKSHGHRMGTPNSLSSQIQVCQNMLVLSHLDKIQRRQLFSTLVSYVAFSICAVLYYRSEFINLPHCRPQWMRT